MRRSCVFCLESYILTQDAEGACPYLALARAYVWAAGKGDHSEAISMAASVLINWVKWRLDCAEEQRRSEVLSRRGFDDDRFEVETALALELSCAEFYDPTIEQPPDFDGDRAFRAALHVSTVDVFYAGPLGGIADGSGGGPLTIDPAGPALRAWGGVARGA